MVSTRLSSALKHYKNIRLEIVMATACLFECVWCSLSKKLMMVQFSSSLQQTLHSCILLLSLWKSVPLEVFSLDKFCVCYSKISIIFLFLVAHKAFFFFLHFVKSTYGKHKNSLLCLTKIHNGNIGTFVRHSRHHFKCQVQKWQMTGKCMSEI